jgi:hypothetical protein
VRAALVALVLVGLAGCRPAQPNFAVPICDAPGIGCGCPLAGWIVCGDAGVDPRWDPGHWGACGVACGSGAVCVRGECAADCGGVPRCGDACSLPASDPWNCGECGNACDGACRNAACVPRERGCPAGRAYCAGIGCVDLDTDSYNCGECGADCGGGRCFLDSDGAHQCCLGPVCAGVCFPPGMVCP